MCTEKPHLVSATRAAQIYGQMDRPIRGNDTHTPLVSVCMIAFNAAEFIEEAITGVLGQEVDFPIELVIGDDDSSDHTRAVCAHYSVRFPQIVRLLPPGPRVGMAANTVRALLACRGRYISICDGDDAWSDPLKLKKQLDILQRDPSCGIVYSDVETVDAFGCPVEVPEHDRIRERYHAGDVFIALLQGNFINNSTAVFRRELTADLKVSPDRNYHVPDYIRWLHIAARSRVAYLPEKTTLYRKHGANLSVNPPSGIARGNRDAVYAALYDILPLFDRHNRKRLEPDERLVLFRRILSAALRGGGTPRQRLRLLRILPRYLPGTRRTVRFGLSMLRRLHLNL